MILEIKLRTNVKFERETSMHGSSDLFITLWKDHSQKTGKNNLPESDGTFLMKILEICCLSNNDIMLNK